jgi:hypothetical protein
MLEKRERRKPKYSLFFRLLKKETVFKFETDGRTQIAQKELRARKANV